MNHATMTLLGRSLWSETSQPRAGYAPLQGSLQQDVAVVGGGIAGLTSAILLQREGRSVAVLEADHLGAGTTGDSTAQATSVPALRHAPLLERMGREAAVTLVGAWREGLETMDALQRLSVVPCGWARIPAYLFSESRRERGLLEAEIQAARGLGAPATLEEAIPLPMPVAGAVCFPAQARFHPIDYLQGLASQLVQDGGRIFEATRVTAYEEGRDSVVLVTDRGRIRAGSAILATPVPLGFGPSRLGLTARSSYVSVLELRQRLPDALFWDTAEPPHRLRICDAGKQLLMVGGEDHDTRLDLDPLDRYGRLEEFARSRFPVGAVVFRWVAHHYATPDDLPCVDRSALPGKVFVAAGYSSTGPVTATLAGRALTDLVQGRDSRLAPLLAASRFAPGDASGTTLSSKE